MVYRREVVCGVVIEERFLCPELSVFVNNRPTELSFEEAIEVAKEVMEDE